MPLNAATASRCVLYGISSRAIHELVSRMLADLRGSTPNFLLISFAASDDVIMATVLFEVQIHVSALSMAIANSALRRPFIIF